MYNEMKVYLSSDIDTSQCVVNAKDIFVYLDRFWDDYKFSFPIIEKLFQFKKSISFTNCEVEKSFIHYNNVLKGSNVNCKENKLCFRTKCYFNSRKITKFINYFHIRIF